MADSITLGLLNKKLAFFHQMYDIVRLVDPVKKIVIEYQGGAREETRGICYAYWKNDRICDNCISVRSYLGNKCFMKLEQSPEAIMVVTALPVTVQGEPTVLELLKDATGSMLLGSGNYTDGHMMRHIITEMNDLVSKDEMTGLYNRRYVDERLPADIVKSTLEGTPLSVIFMDMDNLKEINDAYGHVLGDQMIIEVTKAVMQCIRGETDWVARYGGDEFLICLNNTGSEAAYQIAERIRTKVEGIAIQMREGLIRTTVSLGSYTMRDISLTVDELIALADQKMYEAKQMGKNATVHAIE